MSRYASAGLYFVPVPIGNRDDITLRALKTLQDADIIACEDTRTTGQLLKMYGIIPNKLLSVHEHNEVYKAENIVQAVQEGKVVAFVSDAGTPGISDPGVAIVAEAIKSGIYFTVLPGPTAWIPALVASGFSCSPSTFLGFPPAKEKRKEFFTDICTRTETLVMYESPHRLAKTLQDCINVGMGNRRVAICKELSKKFENIYRSTIAEALEHIQVQPPKGEYVVVVDSLDAIMCH